MSGAKRYVSASEKSHILAQGTLLRSAYMSAPANDSSGKLEAWQMWEARWPELAPEAKRIQEAMMDFCVRLP